MKRQERAAGTSDVRHGGGARLRSMAALRLTCRNAKNSLTIRAQQHAGGEQRAQDPLQLPEQHMA
jgi:hypothetical protein